MILTQFKVELIYVLWMVVIDAHTIVCTIFCLFCGSRKITKARNFFSVKLPELDLVELVDQMWFVRKVTPYATKKTLPSVWIIADAAEFVNKSQVRMRTMEI